MLYRAKTPKVGAMVVPTMPLLLKIREIQAIAFRSALGLAKLIGAL